MSTMIELVMVGKSAMSRYRYGRYYESRAARVLRSMGLYAIRIPLSKGFFIISASRSDNGKAPIVKCNGDIAAWCDGGFPVPVEVKRVGGHRSNKRLALSIAVRRLRKHRWSEYEVFLLDGNLPVMISTGKLWLFGVFNRASGHVRLMEPGEFRDVISSLSQAMKTRLFAYESVAIIPYGGNESPC